MITPSSPLQVRRQLDALCDEFESVLRSGRTVAVEPYLLRVPAEARRDLLRELAAVHLEFLIESGQSARVEDLLQRFPQLAERPGDVVELIVAEVELRHERRESVDLADYYRRFPEYRELLAARLPGELTPTARQLSCPRCRQLVLVDGDEATRCGSCGSLIPPHGAVVSWAEEQLPTLGRFELQRAVGRGAFGTVYKAFDTDLGRMVAVKVPRSGTFLSREDEERFVREARHIAKLKHPGIVSVYEVGQADGFPFIVTEFIEGVTLADALTGHRFRHAEAAQVIAELADALAHSHQQGVIHRDVKPSNILLELLPVAAAGDSGSQPTLGGSRYRPRLTDFGLARHDEGDATVTRVGQVIGTPAYMSPEQARGDNDRVDQRSDLFSLGVVLYQLLTGETPFRGNGRMLLHQMMHNEPRAPRKLDDSIPRDLETVCLKCLEKDPSRRYQCAEDLANDLRLHLRGEPVRARSISSLERAWRWCCRNPVVAGLEASVALLLLAVSIVSTLAAFRFADLRVASQLAEQQALANASAERHERERAEAAELLANRETQRANQEAATARQVADFLVNVFQSADPLGLEDAGFNAAQQSRRELLARDVLDQGAARLQAEFPQPTLTKAELLDAIGFVYCNLGLYVQAKPMLEESLRIRSEQLPATDVRVALSLFHLGWLHQSLTEYTAAERHYAQALAIRQQEFGADGLEVAEVKFRQAWLNLELLQHDLAEATFREVVDIRRRRLPADHRDVTIAQTALAITLLSAGKSMEALTIAVSNLESSSDAVATVNQYVMARTYRGVRDFERADKAYQTTLTKLEKILGTQHLVVGLLLGDFAGMLREKGDLARAEPMIQRAIEIGQRTLPTHPKMIEAQRAYADALVGAGRVEEALGLYNQALQGLRARRDPAVREQAELLLARAGALRRLERPSEMVETYQEILRLDATALATNGWLSLAHEAADVMMNQQQFSAAAESLRRPVQDLTERVSHEDEVRYAELRAKLGRSLFLAGEVTAGKAELLAGCEALLKRTGADAPPTQTALEWLVELLEQQGDMDLVTVYRRLLKSPK